MTWKTSTPENYRTTERQAIQDEHEPLPAAVQRNWFLSRLFRFGDGWMDLRALRKGEKPIREFVTVGDATGLENFVARYGITRDLYVGAAPRLTRANGCLSNCPISRVIWVDIDFKKIAENVARDRLGQFGMPPNIEVRSGGGLHVYWVLEKPVDLQTDPAGFTRRLVGTAIAIGGDVRSAEPAHILRLPGTMNFKYSPPREVTLARF